MEGAAENIGGLAGFPFPEVPPPEDHIQLPIDAMLAAYPPDNPNNVVLADVDAAIREAIKFSEYPRKSYYAIGLEGDSLTGFALVVHVEQIDGDSGEPIEGRRFDIDLPDKEILSVWDFVEAVLNAEKGCYRIAVFLVTNQDWNTNGRKLTAEQAERLVETGAPSLTAAEGDVHEIPLDSSYEAHTLIYEFEKPDKHLKLVERDLPATAIMHLSTIGDIGDLLQ